jgi:hypothetical protein
MARILGDKLRVNVARKAGEEQIIDLMELFNRNPNKIITVAATVGADGAPNTCPVSLIYAAGDKTLLVATLRNTASTANLRRDGRVCLEIIAGDDLVMGVKGVMQLLRDPMECSDAMVLWKMQVDQVKQDTSPAQRVTQGPAATPRSEKAAAFEQAAFAELMAVTG